MTKRTDKKRDDPIAWRPPVGGREQFDTDVAASGMSRNAYMTQRILGGEPPRTSRRPVIEQQLVAQLLSQAARLHDDLHQISLMAGESPAIVMRLEQANAELAAIRAACFKAFGRTP